MESTDVGCTRPALSVSQSDPGESEDRASDQSIASDFRPVTDTDLSRDVRNMDGQTVSCEEDTNAYTDS